MYCTAYGREMIIQFTALVDIPADSMPIARSLKTCEFCGIALCDKTAHFLEWLFIMASLRHTCEVDGLSQQRKKC